MTAVTGIVQTVDWSDVFSFQDYGDFIVHVFLPGPREWSA